jgi:hypothetical protein
MLDPSLSGTKFGVFDFDPFVPSGRMSMPFDIADEEGRIVTGAGLTAAFGEGTVMKL